MALLRSKRLALICPRRSTAATSTTPASAGSRYLRVVKAAGLTAYIEGDLVLRIKKPRRKVATTSAASRKRR